MSTDEQRVRGLLAPHLMGLLDEPSVTVDVREIEVLPRGRTFDVALDVVVRDERWRVRVRCDNSDSVLYDAAPPPHVVRSVAHLIRVQLFEWWHTKGRERRSAALGERLP
ncbi:hypothetical protein [Streptomyces sp. NPDC057702]|uniref:hypothetical protein n=1 Tax=unclassified Streptomyces TaxID=2593676 RepID=UPI00369B8776